VPSAANRIAPVTTTGIAKSSPLQLRHTECACYFGGSLRLLLLGLQCIVEAEVRQFFWVVLGLLFGGLRELVRQIGQPHLLLTQLAEPLGPTCHKGTASCFADAQATAGQRLAFLATLEATIAERIAESPEGSYTARLYAQGPSRIAQKLGEEGVETALAAVTRDDKGVVSESADLLYHLLVLLKSRNLTLQDVVQELASRHAARG